MAEHTLPDDVTQWPNDPYRLIGVDRSADWNDIRRAYARLIRQYKPEHEPDKFQRIRSAYEYLQQFHDERLNSGYIPPIPFTQSVTQEPEVEKPSAEDPGVVEPGGQEPADTRPPADEPPIREQWPETSRTGSRRPPEPPTDLQLQLNFEQRLQRATQTVGQGACQAGYELLVELEQERPGHPQVCLRLYWLTRLQTDLRQSFPPAQWLLKSLIVAPQLGPVWDTLLAEFEVEPALSLLPGCETLQGRISSGELLLAFTTARWQALIASGNWEEVAKNLDFLQRRLEMANIQLWGRTLLEGIYLTLWHVGEQQQRLFLQCYKTVQGLTELSLPFADEFLRLDRQLEAARGVFQVSDRLPTGWMELIAASWEPQSPKFNRLISRICGDWLGRFSEVEPILRALCKGAPQAAAQLCGALELRIHSRSYHLSAETRDWIATSAQHLFGDCNVMQRLYPEPEETLAFCLQQQITIPQLHELLTTEPAARTVKVFFEDILNHVPLRLLTAGCLAAVKE